MTKFGRIFYTILINCTLGPALLASWIFFFSGPTEPDNVAYWLAARGWSIQSAQPASVIIELLLACILTYIYTDLHRRMWSKQKK